MFRSNPAKSYYDRFPTSHWGYAPQFYELNCRLYYTVPSNDLDLGTCVENVGVD